MIENLAGEPRQDVIGQSLRTLHFCLRVDTTISAFEQFLFLFR